MITQNVQVGIVGAGGRWAEQWLRCLSRTPGAQLVALCDSDKSKVAVLMGDHALACYDDLSAMLKHPRLDAVVLSTPPGTHVDLGLKIIEAGKHLLVEQPMALTVHDCNLLTAAAKLRNVTIMVGHTYCYNPAVRKIKEIIRDGRIGNVLHVESRRVALGAFSNSTDAMWDLAPHDVSIMMYILDMMPSDVKIVRTRHVSRTCDTAVLDMLFGTATCTIKTSWVWPRKIRDLVVIGSLGSIIMNDTDRVAPIRLSGSFATPGQVEVAIHEGRETIIPVDVSEPLMLEAQHFVDSIRSGRSPISSGAFGTNVVRVLEQ